MTTLKTKEEIECEFHKFTNNIFMDKLPLGIQDVVSKPAIKSTIHKNILEHIIYPINIKTKLGLDDKSLGMPRPQRFNRPGEKVIKKKVVNLTNSSVFYITNLLKKDCKQLLLAANPTNDLKDKYSEIKEVIDRLNMLDFSNIKTNLSKTESKYSVVILDNTVSETPIISASYRSENFLVFYRINKLISKRKLEEVIMPIYILNHNEPEKSSFIFSKPEIKSVISNIESLTTFPQDESKSSVSQSTDKPTIDLTADKPTIDLTAEESKAEAKSSPKHQTKPESKSEPDISPEAIFELSNLESNPYDKNQYLRVISFKEIPNKTFLQGRAKPDIRTTSYNLYENKDDNKLVGVLQYRETGLKVTVNVKWCLNYTPN